MTYLEKLRALELEKGGTPSPTKPTEVPSVPTKAPFVASVGTPPTPVLNIEPGPANDSDPAAEARRQRVVAMLAGEPALRIAVVCDGEGDPVPVAVGIRDKGTCEVHIPAARFDPFSLLELIARHGATVH